MPDSLLNSFSAMACEVARVMRAPRDKVLISSAKAAPEAFTPGGVQVQSSRDNPMRRGPR